MDKILYVIVLVILGIFFAVKMAKPPVGSSPQLKSIMFTNKRKYISKTTLGEQIFIAKGKRKFILPTEQDLWTEVSLFENGILFKRNKKEKTIFFQDLYQIEPVLVNSLFVKGKYFGYILKYGDHKRIMLKSSDLWDLDILIEKICSMFPPEKGIAVIMNVK